MATMEKNKVVLIAAAVVVCAGCFALGRFMTPEKVRTEKEFVFVEKKEKTEEKSVKQDVNKDRRTEEERREITRPDGTKEVITRKIEDVSQRKTTDKDTKTEEKTDTKVTDRQETEKSTGRNRVTISALGALNLKNLSESPDFGAQVSKPLLGPLTLGVFGFQSGRAGLSLGLQF
jgi:capsular polysaccharide biosynthesis protein